MVLVVNNSLGMTKGKIAAQCSHAAVSLALWYSRHKPWLLEQWHTEGSRKIVVRVDSTEALEKLFEKVKTASLPCYLVRDAGYTQIEAGSKTVLGIGPLGESSFAELTDRLKLM